MSDLLFPLESKAAIQHLRDPQTIRRRCHYLLEWAIKGNSNYFEVCLDKLAGVADYVASETKRNYPDLAVPFHARRQHFLAGGHDRISKLRSLLKKQLPNLDAKEQARIEIELTFISVLLDAGAGDVWKYQEKDTGDTYSRSEGLAVASFDMFCQGAFSSKSNQPFQVDKLGLQNFDTSLFYKGFQITDSNPLVGAQSRVALLNNLSQCLDFSNSGRLGHFYDYLVDNQKSIQASDILIALLERFSTIWPSRLNIEGTDLGDVWQHNAIGGEGPSANLVSFHKLSQWLAYSLIEPIVDSGVEVLEVDMLTGLPEYRNGGLMLDLGLLAPKSPEVLEKSWPADSPLIVEWRALTLALLDNLHAPVCERLGVDRRHFPLTKVLQGGSWSAGRRLAAEKRPGAGSPIQIDSDGTVF